MYIIEFLNDSPVVRYIFYLGGGGREGGIFKHLH